ncbi:MAG: Anti-sigma regulatory factor (Ser/Thr protein kinase) [Ignavibacteriae bacterium]|nr:MAG: Anti-sigma regulatory factor (Ser/Thr protein kinase) [Ignavibacteriota bacterium]
MNEVFSQTYEIRGNDFQNAGKVSTDIKTLLKQLGIRPEIIRKVAIACYEAEMNIVMYAKIGTMRMDIDTEKIKITVSDQGPGIADIELAMTEGYSTATQEMREMGFGAGMGLPNIKKNSDEFKIESTLGIGTKLEITIFIN